MTAAWKALGVEVLRGSWGILEKCWGVTRYVRTHVGVWINDTSEAIPVDWVQGQKSPLINKFISYPMYFPQLNGCLLIPYKLDTSHIFPKLPIIVGFYISPINHHHPYSKPPCARASRYFPSTSSHQLGRWWAHLAAEAMLPVPETWLAGSAGWELPGWDLWVTLKPVTGVPPKIHPFIAQSSIFLLFTVIISQVYGIYIYIWIVNGMKYGWVGLTQ